MKLTKPQRAAIGRAEPTFDGEEKIASCHGRTARSLRNLGLAIGDLPHMYLTSEGKAVLHGQA